MLLEGEDIIGRSPKIRGMELPARFHELPTWAAVLSALVGLLVVLTGLSMVLGVVFAGIAVGVELGSLAVGALAVLFGLLIFVAPVAAFLWLWASGDDEDGSVAGGDGFDSEESAAVDELRDRYVDGEIGEARFEREMDELLGGPDGGEAPDGRDARDDAAGASPGSEIERGRETETGTETEKETEMEGDR